MKKIKLLFIYFIAMNIIICSNCYAFNAYSVGSKYAVGVTHAGDDLTLNVTNAAMAYKKITGCNSYKSLISSYDYMRGSRLGSSRVYFINGHANYDRIATAGYDKDNYRTGISIYNDGYAYNDNLGDKWIFAGLNGRNMSGTRLITFAGCLTASQSNNLTTKAVEQGAKTAVGFSTTIYSRTEYGPTWLIAYNDSLANGYNITSAVDRASISYPSSSLTKGVVIKGNTSTKLVDGPELCSFGSLNESQSYKSLEILLQEGRGSLKSIENTYKKVMVTSQIKLDLSKKEEINYSNDSIIKVVNLIKKEDLDFNENDYKITYNIVNEERGYAYIFFTYFINGNIETNKVYLAIVDNNNVRDIVLAGVKESNINKVKSADNNALSNKLNNFEKNDKKDCLYKEAKKMYKEVSQFSVNDIFTNSNEVNVSKISKDIKDYEEKYFYDYNTNELSYKLMMGVEIENGTYDGEMIKIVIE